MINFRKQLTFVNELLKPFSIINTVNGARMERFGKEERGSNDPADGLKD